MLSWWRKWRKCYHDKLYVYVTRHNMQDHQQQQQQQQPTNTSTIKIKILILTLNTYSASSSFHSPPTPTVPVPTLTLPQSQSKSSLSPSPHPSPSPSPIHLYSELFMCLCGISKIKLHITAHRADGFLCFDCRLCWCWYCNIFNYNNYEPGLLLIGDLVHAADYCKHNNPTARFKTNALYFEWSMRSSVGRFRCECSTAQGRWLLTELCVRTSVDSIPLRSANKSTK